LTFYSLSFYDQTTNSHIFITLTDIKVTFLYKQSAATIAVSSSSTSDTSDKRTIKKYGSKLDATDSPSRSRSATKELICK